MRLGYVNFETAKMLKEKGFDWFEHLGMKILYYDKEGVRKLSSCLVPADAIMCPTQELARKWLRDVKDIHITIVFYRDIKWQYIVFNLNEDRVIASNPPRDRDLSYEKSLESALRSALDFC